MRARRAEAAVVTRVEGGIARLALARPATRNGFDETLVPALCAACETLALDDGVHVVVLEAQGRDFSLGLSDDRVWLDPSWPDPVAAVAALPQPVVAAIDGEARGWGFALALACDLRILTTRAVLSAPDASQGRLAGGGLTQRLPRMIGASRAAACLLLGTRIGSRDALAWGLAADVVAPGRLRAQAGSLARALAARGPIALRYAKEAVRRALDLPLEDGVRLEHDLYVLLQTTADRREGIAAFHARRKPRFAGR